MKKLLCVLLALVMVLSLAACGGETLDYNDVPGGDDGDASNDPAVTLSMQRSTPWIPSLA